jgi:hypothetical protein
VVHGDLHALVPGELLGLASALPRWVPRASSRAGPRLTPPPSLMLALHRRLRVVGPDRGALAAALPDARAATGDDPVVTAAAWSFRRPRRLTGGRRPAAGVTLASLRTMT